MGVAHRIMAANRARKWRLFLEAMQPTAAMTVLDVGFSAEEYSPYDNYIEKRYPFPRQLTALGIEEPGAFRDRYPDVTAIRYAGGAFPTNGLVPKLRLRVKEVDDTLAGIATGGA